MSAEQLLAETPDERAAVVQVYLELCKEIEKREQSELEVGRGTHADVSEASLARVEAELMAAKVRDEQAESARIADVERRLGDLERKFDAAAQGRDSSKSRGSSGRRGRVPVRITWHQIRSSMRTGMREDRVMTW